jgi:cell division protein FtsL
MLHKSPVGQSSPSTHSPRHVSPSDQTQQQRERSSSPHGFRLGPFLLASFLCLAGVGVYMWPRVQVVGLAYRMQTAEQRLRELAQERDQLRLELASLKDPQRIFRIATEQLGMSTPQQDQVVIVTREGKSR